MCRMMLLVFLVEAGWGQTSQPVYYVHPFSATYHVADCRVLPPEDRQPATPGDLEVKKPCNFCLKDGVPSAGATTTQPALTGLAKYHALLKNEFMKDADGSIVPVPTELHQAVQQIRLEAADEKAEVDDEIAAITADIAAANQRKKSSIQAERERKSEARKAAPHTARTIRYGAGGMQVENRTVYRRGAAQGSSAFHRQRARAQRANAAAAQGDINALIAERNQLQRESNMLAGIGQPNSRTLPPKSYWADLSPEQQEQLGRVGISLDDFKALLKRVGYIEPYFVKIAQDAEKMSRNHDDLVAKLRKDLEDRLNALDAASPKPAFDKPAAGTSTRRPSAAPAGPLGFPRSK